MSKEELTAAAEGLDAQAYRQEIRAMHTQGAESAEATDIAKTLRTQAETARAAAKAK